ncbi:hypothetical protein SAMN04489723_10562 [Algoriphagus aquimarinus]|uniref:Uncharacterized protein n=1 Tax=Algoriphagus aquimarinus TaxID=237018 RepID=A0A1I0YUQ4_9BACT|nr:hypothetical protein SAMN04489723_10562 [Algoriphagus aquimarinus]
MLGGLSPFSCWAMSDLGELLQLPKSEPHPISSSPDTAVIPIYFLNTSLFFLKNLKTQFETAFQNSLRKMI